MGKRHCCPCPCPLSFPPANVQLVSRQDRTGHRALCSVASPGSNTRVPSSLCSWGLRGEEPPGALNSRPDWTLGPIASPRAQVTPSCCSAPSVCSWPSAPSEAGPRPSAVNPPVLPSVKSQEARNEHLHVAPSSLPPATHTPRWPCPLPSGRLAPSSCFRPEPDEVIEHLQKGHCQMCSAAPDLLFPDESHTRPCSAAPPGESLASVSAT